MNNQELEKLTKVLELFEYQLYIENGYKNINGGYTEADMFNFDDEYIDIEANYGIYGEIKHTEQFYLKREHLMNWELSIAQIAYLIEN